MRGQRSSRAAGSPRKFLNVGDEIFTDGESGKITDLDSSWTDYSGESNPGIEFEYTSGPDKGKRLIFKSEQDIVEAKRAVDKGWRPRIDDALEQVLEAAGYGADGQVLEGDAERPVRIELSEKALERLRDRLS